MSYKMKNAVAMRESSFFIVLFFDLCDKRLAMAFEIIANRNRPKVGKYRD